MSNSKILVTGATGTTGGSAIRKLVELRVPVRALVHKKDARSERLSTQGVEIVLGDLLDFAAVTEALKEISAAYFVFPIQVPGILEATAFFAQAAIDQGVRAIVNMSQTTARRAAKSHAARDHWIAERLLDRSGIPVTHLRPTVFAEWLKYLSPSIREKNILPLPFANARYAPIAGEDLGRAIAAILKDPAEHAGKSYPLRARCVPYSTGLEPSARGRREGRKQAESMANASMNDPTATPPSCASSSTLGESSGPIGRGRAARPGTVRGRAPRSLAGGFEALASLNPLPNAPILLAVFAIPIVPVSVARVHGVDPVLLVALGALSAFLGSTVAVLLHDGQGAFDLALLLAVTWALVVLAYHVSGLAERRVTAWIAARGA